MGIVYHHDPRKISDSSMASQCRPQQHDVTDDEPGPSDQSQTSRYRSQVARCLFFSQDRADMTFIVNELCQRMSYTRQQSLSTLKRLVRYSKRDMQRRQVSSYGKWSKK